MISDQLYQTFLANPSVSTDTRKDPKDTIFFCLRGPNFDANTFAEEALKKGAVAVVSDADFNRGKEGLIIVDDVLQALQQLAIRYRESFTFPVIGLTGSNGKTTNKELISSVLIKKYKTAYTSGNLNNHIGVPLSILSIPRDTEMAVIEMGANHVGEIAALSKISDPDLGMITNIGKAHLEGFGGIEGVKKGKSELYDHLKKKNGKVFVNGDDPVLMDLSSDLDRILFGTKREHFVRGKIEPSEDHLAFSYSQGDFSSKVIQSQLVGEYNFYNMIAAVCIGRYFNVDHASIAEALSIYSPSNNRSQLTKTEFNTLILDAYNANPTSMKAAIDNLCRFKSSEKLALLGQMLELGKDAVAEHQAIINQLKANNIPAMLVGNIFNSCDCAGFPVFESSEALAKELEKTPIKKAAILVKGSRSVQMEKVVEKL
ncbi:MAG TPA: UDP-N-acetylmuramoyl-tripeptide--D-alanyl-D-alanine ligase [Cryomorphaceae bacterium]|nr:UDP-N-acetylmuramoyl-tripeptide--D-alanyl-D-alanine ligase [Cryomorphaceae bacterium]